MSSALRIGLISEHASPLTVTGGVDAGGQNIYVAHVARCLAHAGHEVVIFTRCDAPELPKVVRWQDGILVVHVTAGPRHPVPKEAVLPYMDVFADGVEKFLIGAGGCDLIHANFFMSGKVAYELKRRLRLPYVVTFHALGLVRREHQGEADTFPAARIAIERVLVKDADLIIAECPQDEHDLVRLYDADLAKVRMVPCGFDAKEFAPMSRHRARQALGLAQDDFIVLQLGRLVPRKGIDTVIEALSHWHGRRQVRLLVVGGECRDASQLKSAEFTRLQEVARQCAVEGRVTFTGQRRRDELRHYYAAANVFVTTPWYEPFGITPLEAMACAIPVVASAVGGLTYTVIHGVTGLLVAPRDPRSLATALQRLQQRPALAREMGQAGFARVRAHFTWEQVTASLISAYREILHGVIGAHPSDRFAVTHHATGSASDIPVLI